MFNKFYEVILKTCIRYNTLTSNYLLKKASKAKTIKEFNDYMKSFNTSQDMLMSNYDELKRINKRRVNNCRIKYERGEA